MLNKSTDSNIKEVTLTRMRTGPEGTFGHMIIGSLRIFTLELPNKNNMPNVSCIPVGRYFCTYCYSDTFKKFTYKLQNVLGRSGIRIHPANFAGDTDMGLRSQLLGCIAPGLTLNDVKDGQDWIGKSVDALNDLEDMLDHEPFYLKIVEDPTYHIVEEL